MSLLDEYYQMDEYVIMDMVTKEDGLGGVISEWQEGAKVNVAVNQDTSQEAQIANALGEKKSYTVVTKKNIIFRKDDIIKRLGDGKYFRITSDADDMKTPNSAYIDMRQCTAEEYNMGT